MTGEWSMLPVLPDPRLLLASRNLLWAVVLAWCVLQLCGFLVRRQLVQWKVAAAAAGLVGIWALLPTRYSPAFWLSLAYQSPSLVTAGLCIAGLVRRLHAGPPGHAARGRLAFAVLAVATGWWLLLDTLALVPGSVYALGFTHQGTWAAAAISAAFLACGARDEAAVLVLATFAFAVLRLPSGNVFDALLDPWLWAAMHVVLAQQLLQRRTRRA